MTTETQAIIEKGPYLADEETLRSVANRIRTLDDVRFVLVARDIEKRDRRWLARTAVYFAMLVAAMIGLRLIFGYPWIVNALVFGFVALAHGYGIDRILRKITGTKEAGLSQSERIYALTGTHLHRIAVKNGIESRQNYALGRAEHSARFMSGSTVSYRLRFAEDGIDLLNLPYSPEADAILMQPVLADRAPTAARLAEAA